MFKNYFKIAIRNLVRHKAYGFINVAGLALGLAVCLIIILMIQDQKSYDKFHENADRIVRIVVDRVRPQEGVMPLGATPAYLAPLLKERVPEIEQTVRFRQIRNNVIHEGKSLNARGLHAEPSFFEVFSYSLARGNPATALTDPNGLVLSEAFAARLFGETDPVGQVLTLEQDGDYKVTGVVETTGLKSHLQFDMLASFATLEARDWGRDQLADEASFSRFASYLLLREGATTRTLEATLATLSKRYNNPQYIFKTQPLTEIALGPLMGNEIAGITMPGVLAWLLGGLGLIVLLAAGINYVGLSVAQALGRAKEVGVRKTVGAQRRQVIAQFLIESVLMTLGALVLAYALLAWLVPAFNSLTVMQLGQYEIRPEAIYDPAILGLFVLFSLGVGLLAGLYPAVYLSRFHPARVLKGLAKIQGFGGLTLRKGLIVVQLTFSLVFLITTVLIYRQFTHMTSADFGFRTADLVNVDLQGMDHAVLRAELQRHAGILAIGATSEPPASGSRASLGVVIEQDTLGAHFYSVDAPFVENLELTLLAGRNFAPDRPGEGILVNELALKRFGLGTPEEALGKTLTLTRAEAPRPILGVVQDFHYTIVFRPIEPLVLVHDPSRFRWLTLAVHPDREDEALAHLKAVWARLDPVHPLEYTFYEDQVHHNPLTGAFYDLVQIVGLVAFLALVIACLGLLSAAAYRVQIRTKEIGIRKVVGASGSGIMWLLSKEFIVLFAIAVVLATPLAWLVNTAWLNHIVIRTDFGPGIFALSIGVVLLLALLAVSSQALRGALTNPAQSLRYE